MSIIICRVMTKEADSADQGKLRMYQDSNINDD